MDFTLQNVPSISASIFVAVNGLESQSSTYDSNSNVVDVADYATLASQTPAIVPPQVSITYCVMK
jgi:hypothetical protein